MSEEFKASDFLVNTHVFKQIVKDAMRELINDGRLSAGADESARELAEINAKHYITIPEAELLYRCSDTYLYRCIHKAEAGGLSDPIPYLFAGSYVLPQEAFFDWLKRQRKDEEKDCQESRGENTLRHASLAARKGARR